MTQPSPATPVIHLVDDEEPVRDALTFLLRSHGLEVQSYASGPEFLSVVADATTRGCIVLDVRMEPMSGLQVHDALRQRGVQLPVLFLTGHGDIPMAVEVLQKGAVDFLEKPFSGDHLVQRVKRALDLESQAYAQRAQHLAEADRLHHLTERERTVLQLVTAGKLNKVIADELCVSMRTVEVHRARALEKLGVRSSAEAATLLARHVPPAG